MWHLKGLGQNWSFATNTKQHLFRVSHTNHRFMRTLCLYHIHATLAGFLLFTVKLGMRPGLRERPALSIHCFRMPKMSWRWRPLKFFSKWHIFLEFEIKSSITARRRLHSRFGIPYTQRQLGIYNSTSFNPPNWSMPQTFSSSSFFSSDTDFTYGCSHKPRTEQRKAKYFWAAAAVLTRLRNLCYELGEMCVYK